LSNTEKGIHKELVIHPLEVQVWGGLCMERTICISQEGPEKLDPTIGQKEAILGEISLEEGGGETNL